MNDAPANPAQPPPADLRLASPLVGLPGVGKARAGAFQKLGIRTAADLLRHLPMRYEFEAAESHVAHMPREGTASVRGKIVASRWVGGRGGFGGRGKGRFEATLQDGADTLSLTWFNARYLQDKLHPGTLVRVHGKVGEYRGYPQMVNPRWELLQEDQAVPEKEERLRPIYPGSESLPSERIGTLLERVLPELLPQVTDPLPEGFLKERNMPALAEAYRMAHQPADHDEAGAARRRLAYNELLLLQVGIAIKRHHRRHVLKAPALAWSPAIDAHIRSRLPFTLTDAQDHVVRQIAGDLQKSEPMNRLVQGDVGSGKTAVALYAMLVAAANRAQGAIMAPTELLAEQHYESISRMLEGTNVRMALLTGSQPAQANAREALLAQIAAGQVDLLVGTQALLTDTVKFENLAVAVVDEQHRFGVAQRAALRTGQGQSVPHTLVMTATPIPRTLSLTVFGDLDVSIITGLPPGRTPIATRVVHPAQSEDVYKYVRQRIEQGEQAYVVVPAVEEGQEGAGGGVLKNVRDHAKLIQDKYCEGYKVAAVHGQLKRATRERVMDRFRRGQVHVLVATTVIEVGVDVPNATVMVIEHAERFGLAQLHQLRGRVGRGTHTQRSVCALIAEPTTDDGRRRLQAIAGTTDGFRIAEHDLEIRGMGDFFGTRQSGLPPLRVARIPEDMDLLQLARRDAAGIIEADPNLDQPDRQLLRKVLLSQYGNTLGLIDVG